MLAHAMGIIAHGHALLLQAVPPNPPSDLTPDQQFQITQLALRHAPITDTLVPLGFFIMVVLLAYFGLRRKQVVAREQAELRKHLLDKFATGQEFAAFLETQGGKQFLAEMSQPRRNPWMSFTGGIVCTTLGLAWFFSGLLLFRAKDQTFPGILLLAIGVGLLISAIVSHKLASNTGSSGSGTPSLPNA